MKKNRFGSKDVIDPEDIYNQINKLKEDGLTEFTLDIIGINEVASLAKKLHLAKKIDDTNKANEKELKSNTDKINNIKKILTVQSDFNNSPTNEDLLNCLKKIIEVCLDKDSEEYHIFKKKFLLQ